jgi:hypothetical protein
MKPNELKTGHVYFSCGWSNPKYPVPMIRTYIYIGKNLYDDGKDKSQDEYIFQSPIKYFEEEILSMLPADEKEVYEGPEETTELIVPENSLTVIKDINGLIDFLDRSKKERNASQIY